MELITGTVVTKEGEFRQLLKQAQTGNIIVLYEGKWDMWAPHSEGVIIVRDNKFLLNGQKSVYEEIKRMLFKEWRYFPRIWQRIWQRWTLWLKPIERTPHPQGEVVRRGNIFLVNNQPVYKGKYNMWAPHPEGVIIVRDNKFLLVVYKEKS